MKRLTVATVVTLTLTLTGCTGLAEPGRMASWGKDAFERSDGTNQ